MPKHKAVKSVRAWSVADKRGTIWVGSITLSPRDAEKYREEYEKSYCSNCHVKCNSNKGNIV